ncbi:hypothetical protein ACDW_16920 [Acidovorax sp. DW039]|nr:hypothetical protein ACDW_16920 [Acidovorax sp. DW039]
MKLLRGRGPVFLAGLIASVLAVSGCSSLDVPRADNYPASNQKKARAVHHWDVLADDVAGRIADKIREWPPGEYPIHVSTVSDASFNQGFRKLLITRLLDRGVALSTQPAGVQLVVDAQVVQHPAQTFNLNRASLPLTRLAIGVTVARDLVHAPPAAASVAGTLGAAALLADATSYLTEGPAAGGPTRTEVLITTSLENADRYLARTADVYYIEDADAALYLPKEPAPPSQPAPALPVKQWRVVAPTGNVPMLPAAPSAANAPLAP